jgi:hypothetical protein
MDGGKTCQADAHKTYWFQEADTVMTPAHMLGKERFEKAQAASAPTPADSEPVVDFDPDPHK